MNTGGSAAALSGPTPSGNPLRGALARDGRLQALQKDVLPDSWIETPDCASTDLEDWQEV